MKKQSIYLGVYVALAMIFSYLETWIPMPFGIPGMKLGLANLVTVLVLYRREPFQALLVSGTRVLLSGLLFGSMVSIFYSLAGALVSFGTMAALKKTGQFSIVGVSAAGGVSHNVGQLLVAAVMFQSGSLIYYVPVLLLAGVCTGFINGLVVREVQKRWKGTVQP